MAAIPVPAVPPMASAPPPPAVPALPPPGAADGPPLLPPPLAPGEEEDVAAATAPAEEKYVPSSVSFESVLAELLSWNHKNDGDLSIPASHPVMGRIADALTSAGIENIVERRWDEQLDRLREYKSRHGNCNVPPSDPLGKWVADQREHYKSHERGRPNPLTPERFEKLRELSLTSDRWEKRLDELRAFKDRHGHCDVPLDYPRLGVWVLNQRDAYHFEREEFPQDRIDALDSLGFNWNRWGRNRLKIREDAWDAQFAKLLEYIKENGHSNISQHDKDNEKLGKWIKNQRYEYRKYHNKGLGPSRLGRDRIDKLNEIGFQWRLRPERIPWDDRFQALVEFKKVQGHCRVPMSMPELGKWAKYQRDQYCLFMRGKKAKISQEKVDKLLSIGFEDSLEERVALGLSTEGGDMLHAEEMTAAHQQEQPVTQEQQHHVMAVQQPPQEGIAFQHHGEQHLPPQPPPAGQHYAEHYHHGNPGHAYDGAPAPHQAQPTAEAIHYQHGGVPYATERLERL